MFSGLCCALADRWGLSYRCWINTVWDAFNLRRTVWCWSLLREGPSSARVKTVATAKTWAGQDGTRWCPRANRGFISQQGHLNCSKPCVLTVYRVTNPCLRRIEPTVTRTGSCICAKSAISTRGCISATEKSLSTESDGLWGGLLTSRSHVSVAPKLLCAFRCQFTALLGRDAPAMVQTTLNKELASGDHSKTTDNPVRAAPDPVATDPHINQVSFVGGLLQH